MCERLSRGKEQCMPAVAVEARRSALMPRVGSLTATGVTPEHGHSTRTTHVFASKRTTVVGAELRRSTMQACVPDARRSRGAALAERRRSTSEEPAF
mmetsp:Transcript_55569/g.148210  ORF Transcript_55569/g.148210 Transcript_55569/m.148210 type:complete len:97 (+) Transcript_55569:1287-1577(+)